MNQWAGVKAEDRFWSKVRRTDLCWEWEASHDTRGYGLLWLDRRWIGAHRFAYELLVGRIPEGLELDHLCRNKGCVRPDHLEPVTHRENSIRAVPFKRVVRGYRVTHCKQGHEYTPENTILYRGHRSCRACANEANRRYRTRRRGFLVRSEDELSEPVT
jgi:hypothetical protein